MDPDVAITIAFAFVALLVAIVGAVVAVHESRKDHRAGAVTDTARARGPRS